MSGSVVGNLKIRLDFDSSQFERGMAQARRELSTYDRAVGMSTRIAKDNNYAMGKSSDALHNMRVAYQGNKEMVDKLTEANKKLKAEGDQTGKFEKNANAIRNYQMKMYDLNEEYKKFQREMYTANSVFTKSGKAMESTGKVIKTAGEGISQLGTGITKAGLAVAGTFGVFTKQAIDFEQGLAGVQKTTNASNEEMKVLESNIRELAKEMPIATGELLALGEQAGQLGIPQARIAEFTETMVMMGTSTNLSAEEAGESFARFVNVTGHGLDNLDKLGSAVVHLGNNFATTESEIMNLAMGLAGSLSTVGVAEADILGLSAGMSALGINAERGSSSMSKFFIEMAQDVSTGKGNLKSFAKVSGVTVKEFQQAFEKDAMGAMEMFISGLGKMDESGGDVIGTLKEMEINEIRLRDTVLRLAKGHDVMSDALKASNQGYEKGNALQEEYDILAQTTASQIEIAKNKFKDMGLTIGQALLPAFIDLMDSSEGLIGSIEKGVDWFVNLDDAMKENLVRWTAMALVGGPLLSMFGNVTSGIGGLLIAFGKTGQGIGKLSGLFQANLAQALGDTVANVGGTTAAMDTLADGAVSAGGSKGIGLLIKALSGSAGLPWALGIGAVALAGWAGWKIWGEGIFEANRQTQEWGATLESEAEKTLTSVKDDVQAVTGQFELMALGFDTDTASMVGNMKNIGQSIQDDLNNRLNKTEEYLAGLPDKLRESQQEVLEQHKQHLQNTLGLVDENVNKISEIEKRASDEKRELTATELSYVRELQNEALGEYLTTLDLTADEERSIRQVLAGDVDKITREQAVQTFMTFKDQNDKIQEERRKAIKATKEYLEDVKISPDSPEGREMIANVERYWDAISVSSERSMDEIAKMYPEILEQFNLTNGKMIDESMTGYDTIVATNKAIIDGLTESHRNMEEQAQANMEANDNIISHSVRGAKEWNEVVVQSGDTVGEFKEKLGEATQDVVTWNRIRPLVHSVDLDSNAKKVIGEVAIEQGRWDGMAWEDKEAILKDNFSLTTYKALEDSGLWANLEWKERTAILNNEFSGTVAEAMIDDGSWSKLKWEEQKAILTTNTPETLKQAMKDIGIWDKTNPKIQDLIIKNEKAVKPTQEAKRELDEYGNIKVPTKNPVVNNQQAVRPTKDAKSELDKYNKTSVPRKDINARDNASYKAEAARRSLFRIPTKVTTFIDTVKRTFTRNEKGTNFHRGGMAMVNDERSNRFRELVTLPDGSQFIPEGKNVMLDLPRGSKVLRASLTQRMFPDLPQYADGVGLQTTRVPKAFNEREIVKGDEYGGLQRQIDRLAQLLGNQQQQVQTQGVTINIGTIENNTEHDIPRILEEASWIMQGEGNRLNG